jgi:hypothetical protein
MIRDNTEEANPRLQESDLPVFRDNCRDRDASRQGAPYVIKSVQEIADDKGARPVLQIDLMPSLPQAQPHSLLEGGIGSPVVGGEVGVGEDDDAGIKDSSQGPESGRAYTPRPFIAGPLRIIQYSQVKSRVTLIEQLLRTIPHNEYGLPAFFYRPDLLDYTRFQTLPTMEDAKELQELLAMSITNISYAQGFPSLGNGQPLWAQFDWETYEEYVLFTQYLEQGGIRSIHKMKEGATHLSLIKTSLEQMHESFVLNYWNVRSRAYDLYQAAHEQRIRISKVMNTEDYHFSLAHKLLAKVAKRIDEFGDEDLEAIDPIAATKMLTELSKVQRVSIGLPAQGAVAPKDAPPPVMSAEQQMFRLAHNIPNTMVPIPGAATGSPFTFGFARAGSMGAGSAYDDPATDGPSTSSGMGIGMGNNGTLTGHVAAAGADGGDPLLQNAMNGAQQAEVDLLRDRPDLVDEAQELILKLMAGPKNG